MNETWKGVLIRLTPQEKARLREVLNAQGISSMSGYFRHLAVQHIRGATAQPGEAVGNDIDQR